MASGVWKANGGGDGAEKMPGCCSWSLPAASKPAGQQHCISRTFVVPFIIRQHELRCQFCLEPCRCLRSLQAPPPGSLRAGIGCWRTPFPPSPPPAEAQQAAPRVLLQLPCLLAAGWGIAVRFFPSKRLLVKHPELVPQHQVDVCGVVNEASEPLYRGGLTCCQTRWQIGTALVVPGCSSLRPHGEHPSLADAELYY